MPSVLEIGLGQLAVACQCLVDDLVERRIVSGRIHVPDLAIARDRCLPKRLDLSQRDLGEGECTVVFVKQVDHGSFPHGEASRSPASINQSLNNGATVSEENERAVNGMSSSFRDRPMPQ